MSARTLSTWESIQSPVISREGEFRLPEEWVAAGAALQAPNGDEAGRILVVRIGLDLGTAYTKVALYAADKVFFVPWNGTRNSSVSYLLPGEISLLENESVWLGRAPGAARVRSGLKLPFLNDQGCGESECAAAVAFLALVLRYARAWFYRSHAPLLRDRRIVWQLNLGCPTNSWSSTPTAVAYKTVAARGWGLSQVHGDMTWANAMSQQAPSSVEDIGLDGLHSMPEFVAQLAGYVRSPQRKNGLYCLMDVGASTVDLATFNIHGDDDRLEDCYPIFASEVVPLGTHFLMATRSEKLGLQGNWDDLQPVPTARDLATSLNLDERVIETVDRDFAVHVRRAVSRVLSVTRARRYGTAPEWHAGLPVFLSGGGATCELYRRALVDGCNDCKVPHRLTLFPLLDDTAADQSVAASDFHRLSVAYGLTFDAASVGRILAPQDVADAPAYSPMATRRQRPDRDDLYAK